MTVADMAVAYPPSSLSKKTDALKPGQIPPWFALQIRQKYLASCEQYLQRHEYELFSPKTTIIRQWSDRKKKQQVSLFPGYIFCRFDPEKRLPILQATGVIGIVSAGRTLLEVNPSELEAIRLAIASGAHIEPVKHLVEGSKVHLVSGPLAGLEGVLLRIRNRTRLILSVSMLNRSVSVEVDSADIADI